MNRLYKQMIRGMIGVVGILASAVLAQAGSEGDVFTADTLLRNGQVQEALSEYLKVIRLDPKNSWAHHGAGVAYDALGQPVQAVRSMEKAYSLLSKDRVIVHNVAWVLYKNNTQPRALKLLKDYLAADPSVPDEPLLNTLIFMLENASAETRKTRLYAETDSFVQQYTRSLERQVPGFARWADHWIPVQVYDEKIAQNKKVQSEADRVSEKIKRVEQDLVFLNRQTPEIEMRVRRGFDHSYVLRRHLEQIRQLDDQRIELVKQRDQILEKLELPPQMRAPDFLSVGSSAPALPTVESLKGESPSSTTVPERPIPTVNSVDKPISPPSGPKSSGGKGAVSGTSTDSAKVSHVTEFGVAFAVSEDTLVTSQALVDGALDITVQSSEGTTDQAKVIQADPKSGLALLRLSKLKAPWLGVADNFAGGPVECIAIAEPDLFKSNPGMIRGKADRPTDRWTISLSKNPRRPGAPLISDGKVIGVTLAGPETQADSVPGVPLGALKELIGQNPRPSGPSTNDPFSAIFQVVISREKKE